MLKSALWGERCLQKSVCQYTWGVACPRPIQAVIKNKRTTTYRAFTKYQTFTLFSSLIDAIKTSSFKLKLKFEEVKLATWGPKVHRWGDFQANHLPRREGLLDKHRFGSHFPEDRMVLIVAYRLCGDN